MPRLAMLLAVLLLIACGAVASADTDAIEAKLIEAKKQYDSALEKVHISIVEALDKKCTASKKAGDLKAVEAVQSEINEYEQTGTMPRSIPTKGFVSQIKLARTRVEDAFSDSIRQYTKDGKIELAKAIQQELDDFKTSSNPPVTDAVKKGTIWQGTLNASIAGNDPKSYELTITILERAGKRFKARYEVGGQLREINGTIDGSKIQWLAKDVKVLKGFEGYDYTGKVETSQVTVSYSGTAKDGRVEAGTAVLKLRDSKR